MDLREMVDAYGLEEGQQMAQTRRASAMERVKLGQELVLGVPPGISAEGARKVDDVLEYLYTFRVGTLEQLTRCLPGETAKRMGYWLDRYPYIKKRMVSIERYDVSRHEWIRARKIGVYALTVEAVILYENAMGMGDKGYYTSEAENPEYKPENVENALHAIELFTRTLEINQGSPMTWVSNQYAVAELRDRKFIGEEETLSTSGFMNLGDDGMWGVATYLNRISSVLNNTKKAFPSQFAPVLDGIMLVRNEHFGRAHGIAYNREESKGVQKSLYFRFIPYEFSLEHPKWFLGILRKNRWVVLDALFESIRQRGGVVEQVQYSTEYAGSSHEAFRFRVIHAPDENGRRRVEYVDTSYGASVSEFIGMLSPKSVVDAGDRTMYVVEPGEVEAYERITRSKGLTGIQFRLIDWPGGK